MLAKLSISNVSSGHGLVFDLSLVPDQNSEAENCILEFLKKQLKSSFLTEAGQNNSVFYISNITDRDGSLVITFCKEHIVKGKVDGYWNDEEEDQEFPVILINEPPKPSYSPKKYKCYWCKKYVKGIDREAVEIYDQRRKKRVIKQTHNSCQKIRDEQAAKIPFPNAH